MRITYLFDFGDGRQASVAVDVDRAAGGAASAAAALPDWALLERSKCPHCPLGAEARHCPAAADLVPTIDSFAQIISHQEARVTVRMAEREVTANCQAQHALSSLVGLIMASSACPILGRMRGLARTHLPFASIEESMLRVVGAYMIRQWLDARETSAAIGDLSELKAHYADLEVLNKAFRQRLRSSQRQDSVLNAISSLGALSTGIGISLEDELRDVADYTFRPG
ncbi:DUF6901 family protein [Solimonas soli]|uniref:DUF6901 family protein n=1 Tax=Solimonas soli TaxID=413479 RepID=UPI00048744CC|nr:hypothetical protein [Solimonas soli]